MIESTAANMARNFTEYLDKVMQGETIRIRSEGRTLARLIPDCDFMPGAEAAELFRDHRADLQTADAIASELKKIEHESENALAH
jgi:antitoxin (DNA-binding transcriptional repressor) of toxin-antitoxin stability system